MTYVRLLFLTMLAFGVGSRLWAASAEDTSLLARTMADPTEQQHVLAAAQRSTVMLQNPCASAQYSLTNSGVVYRPLVADQSNRISAGAWKQIVNEQGCSARRLLNVLLVFREAGQLATFPILPGTTKADPLLQKDAVRYAVVSGHAQEPGCNIGYVANTQYLSPDGDPIIVGKAAPWKELWTLETCTRRIEVPMRFIPDATGTTISAGPNTAVITSQRGASSEPQR